MWTILIKDNAYHDWMFSFFLKESGSSSQALRIYFLKVPLLRQVPWTAWWVTTTTTEPWEHINCLLNPWRDYVGELLQIDFFLKVKLKSSNSFILYLFFWGGGGVEGGLCGHVWLNGLRHYSFLYLELISSNFTSWYRLLTSRNESLQRWLALSGSFN